MKNTRPYADTRLSKFVETRVLELRPRKSQIEIATEAGYPNPNILAMIKNGSTKMPLDRVVSLAKALECDPRLLFKLALEQPGSATTAAQSTQSSAPLSPAMRWRGLKRSGMPLGTPIRT